MTYYFIPDLEPTIYPAIIYTIVGALLIIGGFLKKEDINKWWLFVLTGALLIPFGFIYGFMPIMVLSSPTDADILTYSIYSSGIELIDIIPRIVALGGLVILIGFLNKDENGKFLIFPGHYFQLDTL